MLPQVPELNTITQILDRLSQCDRLTQFEQAFLARLRSLPTVPDREIAILIGIQRRRIPTQPQHHAMPQIKPWTSPLPLPKQFLKFANPKPKTLSWGIRWEGCWLEAFENTGVSWAIDHCDRLTFRTQAEAAIVAEQLRARYNDLAIEVEAIV